MKKLKTILLLLTASLLLTGCVKYNANMDIKKDKSMEFKIIYAVDTTYFGDKNAVDAEQKEKLEKAGFKFEEYSDGKMKGYTISKKYSNIDNYSSEEESVFDLSGMMNSETTDNKMFKVEKTFLKNTYTAKFTFDSNDSNLTSYNSNSDLLALADDEEVPMVITANENEAPLLTTGEDDLDITSNPNETEDDESDSDFDLSGLSSAMDLKFNVTLPYSALSNNATSVKDENKTLSWDLISDGENTIEFKFELYNMTNIYIVLGAGLLVLIIIVIAIINRKRKTSVPMAAPVDENAVSSEPVLIKSDSIPEPAMSSTEPETKPEIEFITPSMEQPIVNKEPEMSPINEDINADPRISFNNISVPSENNQEVNNQEVSNQEINTQEVNNQEINNQ